MGSVVRDMLCDLACPGGGPGGGGGSGTFNGHSAEAGVRAVVGLLIEPVDTALLAEGGSILGCGVCAS